MHRGMAAQLLLPARERDARLVLLPGTGELCEPGPERWAEQWGLLCFLWQKVLNPHPCCWLSAAFYGEAALVASATSGNPAAGTSGELTTLEPGGFSPPGSTGRAGRLGWDRMGWDD